MLRERRQETGAPAAKGLGLGRRDWGCDMLRRIGLLAAMVSLAVLTASPAGAVHFYRGPGSGCTPAAGEIRAEGDQAPVGAEVLMLHNTFNDSSNLSPVTVVKAGQAVRWTWNSEHCHSVTAAAFKSGYHYPAPEPSTPKAVAGLFDHPVPELEDTSLAYTYTFTEPGTFVYSCVHHATIGMTGVVVVEAY